MEELVGALMPEVAGAPRRQLIKLAPARFDAGTAVQMAPTPTPAARHAGRAGADAVLPSPEPSPTTPPADESSRGQRMVCGGGKC